MQGTGWGGPQNLKNIPSSCIIIMITGRRRLEALFKKECRNTYIIKKEHRIKSNWIKYAI